MPPTNQELCYKCANEPGTIYNMQRIIIPDLLKEIEGAKMVIRCIPELKESVESFSTTIINNVRAIRAFYHRFPELPRVKLSNEQLLKFTIGSKPKNKNEPVKPPYTDDYITKVTKVLHHAKEIAEYGEILRGLTAGSDLVEKTVKRIVQHHKSIKEIII